MARNDSSASADPAFGRTLATRDPDAIQRAAVARLEQERLDRIAAAGDRAAADRRELEAAMKEAADWIDPARLRRVAGLAELIADEGAQAAAAAAAMKGAPPAVPAGGWLAFGRVREADGTPAKGGQLDFETTGDVAARLLKPVKIGADGFASLAIDAQGVAALVKSGEPAVTIAARQGDRAVRDVVPAEIAADGLHQFDLILPPPPGTPGRTQPSPRAARISPRRSGVRR